MKYNRVPKQEYDGIIFDSKLELNRYKMLKLMEAGKEIRDLAVKPKYEIVMNGVKICAYTPDFRYWDSRSDKTITEDVKGHRTAVYMLKKRMMKAFHGISVYEWPERPKKRKVRK